MASLRKDLQFRIEKLLGTAVKSSVPAQGGYTPALRFVCNTKQGNVFVKIGTNEMTSLNLLREITVYKSLQAVFMPHLIAYDDSEIEPILILEDLSSFHWPQTWNEKHVEAVLEHIDLIHKTVIDTQSFQEVHGHVAGNWAKVASNPEPFLSLGMVDADWLERALPLLMDFEAKCLTEGSSLCHWDLRSDNMCINDRQVFFIDWNVACLSNPELDLGFWLPSLAAEGGPQPEIILPDAPEVAAWVSGFFAARAALPVIPDAPRVRWVQKQQLNTALPWAVRALGLSPLIG